MPREITPFAAAILVVALCAPALAEGRGSDWLSEIELTQQLTERQGYSHVTRIEADKDHWQGKGLKDGKLMQFKADPKTGAILQEEPDE